MKKIIAFILALTMIFALCACGGNTDTKSSDEQNTESTENEDENSNSVDENDGQGLSDEEMLAGLWLCTDHIFYDKIVDFMYLTDDGYIFRRSFNVLTSELNDLDCYIDAIGDSTSSQFLVGYYSTEGHVLTMDEIFAEDHFDLRKYEIDDNEIIMSSPNGEKETIMFAYNPLNSMADLSITESGGEYYYEKYDCLYLDDTFRYFVGNWNYEETEIYSNYYYAERNGESHYSGSLFFGENLRVNTSDGDTGGWGYSDCVLKIGDTHYDVIKLSHNVFVLYAEREHDTYMYYDFSFFSRA